MHVPGRVFGITGGGWTVGAVGLWPVNMAVTNIAWSMVLLGVQIGCLVCLCVAYRRDTIDGKKF